MLVLKHNDNVNGAKFSKDEREILSWSDDNTVRLWNRESGKELLVLKHNNNVNGAKFSKDERTILSWSYDKTVRLWDKKSGNELLVLKYHFRIDEAKFIKDEKEIISYNKYGEGKTYKLYRDIKLKKEFYPLEAEVESGCTLTKSGEVRVLSKEEWEEKKRRYEEALRE